MQRDCEERTGEIGYHAKLRAMTGERILGKTLEFNLGGATNHPYTKGVAPPIHPQVAKGHYESCKKYVA